MRRRLVVFQASSGQHSANKAVLCHLFSQGLRREIASGAYPRSNACPAEKPKPRKLPPVYGGPKGRQLIRPLRQKLAPVDDCDSAAKEISRA